MSMAVLGIQTECYPSIYVSELGGNEKCISCVSWSRKSQKRRLRGPVPNIRQPNRGFSNVSVVQVEDYCMQSRQF